MAEQTRLVWTDDIPLEEGYYWIEFLFGIRVIAELDDTQEGLIFSWQQREYTTDKIRRYAGPIPEPDEPKTPEPNESEPPVIESDKPDMLRLAEFGYVVDVKSIASQLRPDDTYHVNIMFSFAEIIVPGVFDNRPLIRVRCRGKWFWLEVIHARIKNHVGFITGIALEQPPTSN